MHWKRIQTIGMFIQSAQFQSSGLESMDLVRQFLGPPNAVSGSLKRWHRSRKRHDLARAPSAFTAVEFDLVTILKYWFGQSELEHLPGHEAKIDARMGPNGPTALLSAVSEGDADLIRRLVNRLCAHVNCGQDTERGSPLCLAISLYPNRYFVDHCNKELCVPRFEVVKVLLEAGADPNFTDGYDAFPPELHLNVLRCAEDGLAKFFSNQCDPEVTELLLYYKADINLSTAKFKTALALAVASPNLQAVKHLLSLGADCNLERPLYARIDNVLCLKVEMISIYDVINIFQLLVNAGALDYLLNRPPGEKTKQDLEYEGRVAMLAECMTKTDNFGGDPDYYKDYSRRLKAAEDKGMPFASGTRFGEHETKGWLSSRLRELSGDRYSQPSSSSSF